MAAKFAKTIADVADAVGASRRTVMEWKRLPDFPKETKRGWNVGKVDAWCKEHGRGKYHPVRGESAVKARAGLKEAKRRLAIHQARNMEFELTKAQLAQEKTLADIVLRTDAEAILSKMKSIVTQVVKENTTALKALLDEIDEPTDENWAMHRSRIMTLVTRLQSDIASAVEAKL